MTTRRTSIVFDTFDEFITRAEVETKSVTCGGHSHGRSDFYGTPNLPAAAKLARTGWAEGADRVAAIRATVSGAVSSLVAARADSIGYDVAGDYLDIGRYLSGEPECFGVHVHDDTQSKPVVRINVSTAISASVSVGSIFSRGAAAIAAIDVIESCGTRVEVWAVNGSRACKRIHETQVLLKSAGQSLDCDRLAFVLCHPSYQRRLGFSVFESFGILATESSPHPVAGLEGITTRPALRSTDFTRKELLEEIQWICEQAGVSIDSEELASL